jgi:hypothetical protein
MLEQQVQERVRIRILQVGKDRGIRRIARLRLAGLRQLQLSNRTSCSCLGEPRFTSWPIAVYASCAIASARPPSSPENSASLSCDTETPASSMSASVNSVGSSMSVRTEFTLSASSARSASATRSVNHDS